MGDNKENTVRLGTTTVGIVCKEGIILAADKRATAGSYVVSHETDKIEVINNNIAVTTAGNASDAQLLARLLKSELELKQMRKEREVKVTEAANLLSRMVYQTIRRPSMLPGVCHFILAGHDSTGNYLFDIFPDGTISRHKNYVSSGSGSMTGAYGILDSSWRDDLTLSEAIKLAVKAINAALHRDMFTGDGVDVFTITEKGVKKVLAKEAIVKIEA